MAFSMESRIVRKKRSKREGSETKSLINKLPKELQTEILKRLSGRDISKAMCVSKSWRELILHTCLPKTPICLFQNPFMGLDHLFNWCCRVMHCRVTPQKLIETCNGLFLFCHKDGEANNLTRGVYHYYVINHVTKQCVAILKPTGQTSAVYSYAALAYDPLESWFFKIVRFQGRRCVNVFSSETGCWTTLTYHLPQEVIEAKWMKKSVYSKGALYRLSTSMHVIKFLVDPQENVENQAVAIQLPCNQVFIKCKWDIGVRGERVLLFMSADVSMIIWELVEHVVGGIHSFEWCEIRRINDSTLRDFNSHGRLLSFHPYHGIVYFKLKSFIYYYFYCHNNPNGPQVLGYENSVYLYLKTCGLPLTECSIPFACCLNKKHPRLFQRLPPPEY